MRPRAAATGELDHLAIAWYEGWRDVHEGILPTELTRARTLESFRERLQAALQQVRVVGPPGTPLGFSLLKDDELYQLYVAREGRGTGLAAAWVADAEDRLAKSGFETAWLACANR
jgi:GNAT superfamily N-acetyltransferase